MRYLVQNWRAFYEIRYNSGYIRLDIASLAKYFTTSESQRSLLFTIICLVIVKFPSLISELELRHLNSPL